MKEEKLEGRGILSLVANFLENPVMTNLLMVFLILGGLMTAVTMRSEVFPTVDVGTITVSVNYPGATPLEVEDSITRRVEEAVLGINGVERVRSYAFENRASVVLELEDFVDAYRIKDEVQAEIDALIDFPPGNAEEPIVNVTQSLSNVLTLVLAGQAAEEDLRETAELLERDLLTLEVVSAVNLRGTRAREISIEVSEDTLRKYGLTFGEVADAVRKSSIELSGGTIKTDSGQILLRTDAKARIGTEFESITLRSTTSGQLISLGDIARIEDGLTDDELVNTYNGAPAIFLDILRNESKDILLVKEEVATYVKTVKLPEGQALIIFRDQTEILADRISLLTSNALLGFALVFLMLVITLDFKLAFWVAMGIPISFLGGFLIFGSLGVSLNMVTLFALIVVIGIVVDDAIVVGENIYAEQQAGFKGRRAAFEGVKNIFAPVLVGVLTTMAAFAPLLFQTGTFAEITRPIPIAVISILFVSLIEALFILPTHLSHEGRWSKGALRNFQVKVSRALDSFAVGPLQRLIIKASEFRYVTLAAAIGFIMIASSFVGAGMVRVVFFPNIEGTEISASLAMPEGAPFEATQAAIDQMDTALKKVSAEIRQETGEDVINATAITIGAKYSQASGPGAISSSSIASHLGQFTVELVPTDARSISSREISRRWQQAVGSVPGAETLTYAATIGPSSVDVGYEMTHADQKELQKAAAELADRLSAIDGVDQIDAGLDLGKRQFEFSMTPAGLAAGLRPQDLARQLRQAYFGEEVQRIQRGRDEIKVYVRYPRAARRDLAALANLRIRLPSGEGVPLNHVTTVEEGRSPTSIERVNGRRILTVTADVDENVTTPNVVNDLIQTDILPDIMAAHPGLRWQLEGGSREQNEDFASLLRGFMLALLVIYALVATQLKSYLQPVIIIVSIPLGIAGAILGHMALGFDLSFISMFGIVALSGVVVNASVVLVDRYNIELKDPDTTPIDAAVRATLRRFRPIALTTITTALGLLPIISETSPQAQFLIPMAVSLATGLLISSTLMLFVLPAIVLIVEDIRGLPGGKKDSAHATKQQAGEQA
ncbi:efflux RND transporter permease subunit [Kordiimonas aestuarii]|uniref:efflux RND transporter permease subunit n=1 Tax=Kordiimonas aestuarii TaxID=1005925 RepID=UPI0021D3D183|nr:efflux RND transporter permease subunit [Kordiimonas aestuarii]